MANRDLEQRLIEGLSVLSLALQSGQRQLALEDGLSTTQAAILVLLESRRALHVRDIAIELGVSQPTVTDSVSTLLAKKLISKTPDARDGRAIVLKLTSSGTKLVRKRPIQTEGIQKALSSLGPLTQSELLVLLTATVRPLQTSGAIAPQRQCINCKHFRPYVHRQTDKPHHCAFVDAAFGNASLRFQCSDHEAALPADQSANWSAFANRAENLRATLK